MERKDLLMTEKIESISLHDLNSTLENVRAPDAWEKIEKAIENGAKVGIIAFLVYSAFELINSFLKKK